MARIGLWMDAALDAQVGRAFLWSPVLFGLGLCFGFGVVGQLDALSLYGGGGAVLLALAALGFWLHRTRGRRPLGSVLNRLAILVTLLSLIPAGLMLAQYRTERVEAPVLIAPATGGLKPYRLTAWVVDYKGQSGSERERALLAPVRIEGLSPDLTPIRVRVSLPDGVRPIPGQLIVTSALMGPPAGPAWPGGYDFARDAWFQGLGGVGFIPGSPRVIETTEAPPLALLISMQINKLRLALAEHLYANLGPKTGGMAAALVTGHTLWLDPETLEAMRQSGLAHILSISGLHMSLVGGGVFFGLRALMALYPPLVLNCPVKKLAAIGGAMAVVAYLLISGLPAPAVRAAVVALAMFAAILMDRQAISFNSLALAAWILLLLTPEAVLQAGFQMSFAATAALVALAEVWPRALAPLHPLPLGVRLVQGAGRALALSSGVSLVAGLATGPMALQHFNQAAPWGLFANLLAAPVTAFLTMPGLFLATLGAGLEGPLQAVVSGPADWGIALTQAIAHWVSRLPGSGLTIPSVPGPVFALACLGLVWGILWRGPWRWAGLPLLSLMLVWPRAAPPDVWLDAAGRTALVRDHAGQALSLSLTLSPKPKPDDFALDQVIRRTGLVPLSETEAAKRRALCRRTLCAATTDQRIRTALWRGRKPPSLKDWQTLCHQSELVVLRSPSGPIPAFCRDLLVADQRTLQSAGGLALYRLKDGQLRIQPLKAPIRRPWSPQDQ